ncbi:MAG: hypothetical protein K2J13_01840, partial [Clostridia bacterium]|nr:hypothetical protein [Clostridia bacterium]
MPMSEYFFFTLFQAEEDVFTTPLLKLESPDGVAEEELDETTATVQLFGEEISELSELLLKVPFVNN